MWVIFLEMGAVILIGAFIVWWTWPKQRSRPGESDKPDKPDKS